MPLNKISTIQNRAIDCSYLSRSPSLTPPSLSLSLDTCVRVPAVNPAWFEKKGGTNSQGSRPPPPPLPSPLLPWPPPQRILCAVLPPGASACDRRCACSLVLSLSVAAQRLPLSSQSVNLLSLSLSLAVCISTRPRSYVRTRPSLCACARPRGVSSHSRAPSGAGVTSLAPSNLANPTASPSLLPHVMTRWWCTLDLGFLKQRRGLGGGGGVR